MAAMVVILDIRRNNVGNLNLHCALMPQSSLGLIGHIVKMLIEEYVKIATMVANSWISDRTILAILNLPVAQFLHSIKYYKEVGII